MENLRKLFERYKIDGYIIPKNDEYFNEYIHPSKDRLKYISNFSGSAGFAVILKNKNYLFVDGRYTIQARNQSGKKFKIFTMPHRIPKNVLKFKKETIIGFDPKLHTERQLKFIFNIKNMIPKSIKQNLVDAVWSNKPKDLIKPFYLISKKNAGETSRKKIIRAKNVILKNKIDFLLVTAPENIAWALNIRGYDTSYSPIPNGRLLISNTGEIDFFTNPKKLKKIKKTLGKKVRIMMK